VRHPATARDFEWDEGNADKLAERGITAQEVEGVADSQGNSCSRSFR
jgi:hypothetical protein